MASGHGDVSAGPGANKPRTLDIQLKEKITFEQFALPKALVDGLKSAGFVQPSPIQLKAIPLGRLGLDLIVQAKSGTGKTCVFSVIALEQVLAAASKAAQVLILAPTREVAVQICSVVCSICKSHLPSVKAHALIGGQSVNQDKAKLKSCQIVVGTPGRILHLINENVLKTASIRLFVLDEADKLLASEFQDDINLIYSKLPANKQILTLSATYPSYMAAYAARYMRSPTFIRLNIVDPSLRGIKQFYKIIASTAGSGGFQAKVGSLMDCLSRIEFHQAIVFTNYQLNAENLCSRLNSGGFPAICIAGSMEQAARNKAIDQLKQFKCRILVSTDLTSRGIDAENVDLVVCMDVPADAETYLHRIGRAGRYGAHGLAISFVCENSELSQFETFIDSYNLKIKQFNESLDDLIMERNAADDDAAGKMEDVTIERAYLSQKDFDKTLMEHEKSRNRKMKSQIERDKRETNKTLGATNYARQPRLLAFSSLNLSSLGDFEASLQSYLSTGDYLLPPAVVHEAAETKEPKPERQTSRQKPKAVPVKEPVVKVRPRNQLDHDLLRAQAYAHYYKYYYEFYLSQLLLDSSLV